MEKKLSTKEPFFVDSFFLDKHTKSVKRLTITYENRK